MRREKREKDKDYYARRKKLGRRMRRRTTRQKRAGTYKRPK